MAIPDNLWQIELMTPSSEGDYQSLVEKASGSPLSHTLIWRDILLDLGMGEPFYWLAYQGRKLLSALPAFVCRTDMGAVLNSLPFVQSTGGVICDPNLDRATRASLVRALVGVVLDWCRASNIGTACIIGSAFVDQQDEASFSSPPDFRAERTIQAMDLTQTLDFPKVIRWMVKKAQSFNPTLREASSQEEARLVYDLYAENMHRMGVMPHDWIVYQTIFARAAGRGWTRFVWAEVENKPIACLILMRHGDIVDYYSVGSTEFGRSAQMNSWLCDQQMSAAKADGVSGGTGWHLLRNKFAISRRNGGAWRRNIRSGSGD